MSRSVIQLFMLVFSLVNMCGFSLWAAESDRAAARALGNLRELEAACDTWSAALVPLQVPMGSIRSGDWLAHNKERGQTFRQYLDERPRSARGVRRTIYVQPIGDFTRGQQRLLDETVLFLQAFFDVPVKVLTAVDDSSIPSRARRRHPSWRVKQFLTTYILNEVLAPRLPRDGAAILGLTATDLWAGPGWNFVFGSASLRSRVGVWSINRNGSPDKSEESFRLALLRTIKTAAHETAHMFTLRHCRTYECLMNGSNSRQESDRRPLACCSHCLAKVWWATGAEPIKRFERLEQFCARVGLSEQEQTYRKLREKLLKVKNYR